MPVDKYRTFPAVDLSDRQWPSRTLTQAPNWCSVDLRDGNQALKTPMNINEKLEFFNLLIDLGFKEIEIGFPAASEVEFQFLRKLIEENRIPDDVYIQVLTQARSHLIEKTFKAIEGAKKVIFHLYNSTSTLQRDVVFKMSRAEIIELAVKATRKVKSMVDQVTDTEIIFEYSPESFTGTELDFSLEICTAVMNIWQPTNEKRAILNLPATVEMSVPNVYADMIEWFSRSYIKRDTIIISVHAHNDRGTAVAASELGLLAGAERVEGTIFGCGERTGNVDIVNIALNLFSQGVDPKLNLQDIQHIAEVYQKCTRMDIHPRHPYVGELVYTAFSGSHQDAIKKGMDLYNEKADQQWSVPYLPIDPKDVGRTYEKIIQINSQSGKGGVAYIMENSFGFRLPKAMHPELGYIVQKRTEETGQEISPKEILQLFENAYLEKVSPFKLNECEIRTKGNTTRINAEMIIFGKKQEISGEGNGPIDALGNALKQRNIVQFKLLSYSEHAMNETTSSCAAAYIQLRIGDSEFFGVGKDPNISTASIKALVSALNRSEVPFSDHRLHDQK